MSKDVRKQVGISDVLKLIFICGVTILVVLFLRNWYLKSKELEKDVPVLENVLTHQIKVNELYNYVHDADTAVVYMCVSSNEKCRSFEKDFKGIIQKNDWGNDIVYLDLKDLSDISSFYEELSNHYSYTKKIEAYPTIIYFEGNSIHSVLTGNDFSKKNVEIFLKGLSIL